MGISVISDHQCYDCNRKWCSDCFSKKKRCIKLKHTGTICCMLGNVGCDGYLIGATHNH